MQELLNQLELVAEELDTNQLRPLFVPSSFFARGNWPGPHLTLAAKPIGLTWCVLGPSTMIYVTNGMQQHWEAQGIYWRAIALQNLRDASANQLYTGYLGDQERPVVVFMMHADGLGPSRLLLTDRLLKLFPNGYRVGIPEMSFGIAFSVHITGQESTKLQTVIRKCHEEGTRPLATGTYAPEDILSPFETG